MYPQSLADSAILLRTLRHAHYRLFRTFESRQPVQVSRVANWIESLEGDELPAKSGSDMQSPAGPSILFPSPLSLFCRPGTWSSHPMPPVTGARASFERLATVPPLPGLRPTGIAKQYLKAARLCRASRVERPHSFSKTKDQRRQCARCCFRVGAPHLGEA